MSDVAVTFGVAIEALKRGERVARAGWNGKGMWLKYVPEDFCTHAVVLAEQDLPNGSSCLQALPWIGMKTADNKFVPWLASQTDMLADDWVMLA